MNILFQGDSITDAGRIREVDVSLGSGYATMVAGELGVKYPNEYEFLNRAISGNRSVDIIGRVRKDIVLLNPDIMSMLVGVNDIWHGLDFDMGVSPERFEKYYNLIIEEVKDNLPDIKLMILEPFALNCGVVSKYPEAFLNGVHKLAEISKKVAIENDAVFVPLQEKFDEMLNVAPCDYWIKDGVHPTAMGHFLIKNAWIEAFEKNFR